MSQPGENSKVALQKKTALENKWRASKARLCNIISCIGTSVPSPNAAPCILEQLDQAKKYMASVFDEMSAMFAPTEQDKLLEDFNAQEKIYNEARSRLSKVKGRKISAKFPRLAQSDGKSIFTFFQSVIQFDTATRDEEKEKYLKQLLGTKREVGWDVCFRDYRGKIASDAALEMLKMKRMPLTILLERFRRCIFLLSFTGYDRDWKLLLLLIIRKCLDIGQRKGDEEGKLKKVISSLADPGSSSHTGTNTHYNNRTEYSLIRQHVDVVIGPDDYTDDDDDD